MSIRHTSTGKLILQNNYLKSSAAFKLEDLDMSALMQRPDGNNSEALVRIRDRLRQSSDFSFPEEPKFSKKSPENTFQVVFPCRNSSVRDRKGSYFSEEKERPHKEFNHKNQDITSFRDAMLRASNLFKVYKN